MFEPACPRQSHKLLVAVAKRFFQSIGDPRRIDQDLGNGGPDLSRRHIGAFGLAAIGARSAGTDNRYNGRRQHHIAAGDLRRALEKFRIGRRKPKLGQDL